MSKSTQQAFQDSIEILSRKYKKLKVIRISQHELRPISQLPEAITYLGHTPKASIGIAVGMSLRNSLPIIQSTDINIFSTCFEEIKTLICEPNLNIKIIGPNSESDLQLASLLPNLKILEPADANEAEQMTNFLAKDFGPTYMRVNSQKTQEVFNKHYKFKLGKNRVTESGDEIALFVSGQSRSRETRKILEKQGRSAAIINVSSLNPIDENQIKVTAQKYWKMVVIGNQFLANEIEKLTGKKVQSLSAHNLTPAEIADKIID